MIGHIIGNYKIEERVLSKELFTIYIAQDTIFDNKVYLKIVSHKISDNIEIKNKYLEEAKLYLKLTHPQILNLLKADEDSGFTYLAYEYFPHKNLTEYLNEHQNLSNKELMDIFFRVCGAVDYAHQSCVIHKNITAANIVINPENKVKLCDFGVSFMELMRTEIHPEQILDDFYYFSPERIKQEPLDERTDIYSLGVVLFYLFSKKYPFEEVNLENLINAKESEKLNNVDSYDNAAGFSLSKIMEKILKRDKNERYLNIKEMLGDIKNAGFEHDYKINISPKQGNWFINKARQDYMARQLSLAAESWEKAVSFDPYNPNIHISMAKLHAELKNTDKAIEHYKLALALSPYQYKWRNELAALYKKNMRYDEAVKEYVLVKKLNKSFAPSYFNYGDCLFYLKRYEEAIFVWTEALKYDKDNLKYFYNIGVANYFLGKKDDAAKNWEEVTKINNKFVKAIYNLSIIELDAGNYDKSFQLWNEVDKIAGISCLKLNLGNHYYRLSNFEKALDYWNTAMNLDNQSWQAYFNMGIYYFDKDENKSREFFEKTLHIKPDNWHSLWNIGYICKKNGDDKTAQEFFNKVLEIKPDYWQINYYLGEKLLKEGNVDEAQKYFLNIADSSHEFLDPNFYKSMGVVFYKNNEIEKALDWLTKSVAYKNFQWVNLGEIPEKVYKASKIIVENQLNRGEEASLLVEDKVNFSLKPELIIAECKEINIVIDY